MQITEIKDDFEIVQEKVGYYCPLCGSKNLSLSSGSIECKHLETISFSEEVGEPIFDRNSLWKDSYEALCISLGLDFRAGQRLDDEKSKNLIIDFMKNELDDNYVLHHIVPPPGYPGVETFILYNFNWSKEETSQ